MNHCNGNCLQGRRCNCNKPMSPALWIIAAVAIAFVLAKTVIYFGKML